MKDRNTAAILALLLGGIGVHKFYLGRTGLGVVYLLFCWTFIPGIIAFIEALVLFGTAQSAFDAEYNHGTLSVAAPQPPQNIVVNVSGQPPAAVGSGGDVAGRIKALHDLKTAGALTDDEFNAEKRKLLGSG